MNGFTKIKNNLIVSNLNSNQFRILCYLIARSKNGKCFPSVGTMSKELSIAKNTILTSLEKLIDERYITKEQRVIGNGKKTSNLYTIHKDYLIIKPVEEEKEETDIFSIFEKEFGRTLAPMEYEIINSWLDTGYEKEIIIEALKEAIFNGVFKLNYIDKILYEWNKKGIKSRKDTKQDSRQEEKKELFDYNWLEEE